ncbi:MAG: glyoxylate/hydroxypyruvate reductase A [Alphaproteobacteria bacterium]|nr:MAG: glyoxylate/hydroxypyruvate reductase A [Alphaproteobacteria bacterium]
MTATVLFAARPEAWESYRDPLRRALAEAGVDARVVTDAAPETVDYIVYAPNGPVRDFSAFTRLRAVLNLWAGVEDVVGNPTLKAPLARMVDGGLTQGMVEYVTGHVLRHHLGMDRYIGRTAPHWDRAIPPLASDRHVGVLGLGELGAAAARALARLGFRVAGWARRAHDIEGVETTSGAAGLERVLARSEILVLLLPLTRETEGILNAERMALMPRGAVVINPGRGALIDDDALVAALRSGRIGHATLDVFRVEPLPPDHPFWNNPRVTVTPHVASETRPETAARVIAENIRRAEAGEPLLHLVDRAAGY